MTRRTPLIAIIAIGLMYCLDSTNSAATGYFYEHPIRPFNPPSFSTLRSTGPYAGISIGQKVVTSPRPRVTAPPLPSLNPLTSLIPTQGPRLQPIPYTQSTANPYLNQYQQQQLAQQRQQQQQQLQRQQQFQFQRAQQQQVPRTQYTYQKPQTPFPIAVQPRISPQIPSRPTVGPTPRPTPVPTQRITPRPVVVPTLRPVVSQRPPAPTTPTINNPTRPASIAPPTTPATPSVSISNPSQAGLLTSPDVYVIDGRQLKQYKVYEEIDNDIDQEVEPFIPANFFVNNYHARISPTHPLSEDFQVESRVSGQRSQTNAAQTQAAQQPNTIAIGSGGLGFVRLPNGNVYLGSGSLGYISGLQRTQEVQNARTRTGAPTPDPLHFGHGPLSDSFYYQSNYKK